jgi:purine-nucleoside/S-methyl-5'-thioadenosine phosphorylase / adenosine deaminase
MIVNGENSVIFLEFPKLASFSGILHGIFTRKNGKSKGPYKSLNVGFGVGDDHRTVLENRKIISRCINAEDLVFLNQVHGRRIVVFGKENHSNQVVDADDCLKKEYSENFDHWANNPGFDSERRLEADAMITNISQKFLVIQTADCQSVLIYDPIQHVVANVHAGWRGSIDDIIGHTVTAMETSFGCRAQNMIAGIGPSLGPCCAEFINYKKEIPEAFWKYKDNADHFDFWSVSRDQLCSKGVLPENVDASRICTKCDPNRFFSFRGEGTTGRCANLIGLK